MADKDLSSDVSDILLLQLLLADLHDDLPGRIARFRYLTDQSGTMGQAGTMIFGGTPAYAAFAEARSSFVNGNFIATVMLCQAHAENILAAIVHDTTLEDLSPRISFQETIARCQALGILSKQDAADLKRLSNIRNPLVHFRTLSDPSHIDRRAITESKPTLELLRKDAYFAIAVMIRLLAKSFFRLDR